MLVYMRRRDLEAMLLGRAYFCGVITGISLASVGFSLGYWICISR